MTTIPEDGIVLIDKPAGMTSFGVVARIRRVLSRQIGKKAKVGHTGTLDPFATGLMILVTGKECKRAGEYTKQDKVYEATFRLGQVSTTGDPEGEITTFGASKRVAVGGAAPAFEAFSNDSKEGAGRPRGPQEYSNSWGETTGPAPSDLSAEDAVAPASDDGSGEQRSPAISEVTSTLARFTGKIEQRPPIFSAIKIDGQRAYKLARDGQEVEIPLRTVHVYSLELLDYTYPYLRIRTHVSSGTYIRSLAVDIGEALGTGAYCEQLRRISISHWQVSDADTLERYNITS